MVDNARWSPKNKRKFRSPEYRAWTMMKVRCYNQDNHKYASYGGRGIKVCKRWISDFDAFLTDMGPRPSKNHSLDRRDNDKDYTPENCRWATRREQARNRRSNTTITIDGVTCSATEWAEMSLVGVSDGLITQRIKRGWDPKRSVFEPPEVIGSNEALDASEWAAITKLISTGHTSRSIAAALNVSKTVVLNVLKKSGWVFKGGWHKCAR